MLLVVVLAGIAALAVVSYTRWSTLAPDRAMASTRNAARLAEVTTVLARAVSGVATAMELTRPQPVAARGPRLIDMFDHEDEEDLR